MTDDSIRPLRRDDLGSVRRLIAAVDLFPDALLPEMAEPWLDGHETAVWLVAGDGAGLAFAAPERLTEGTWNLLLLAVDPRRQRQGLGRRLAAEVESLLRGAGARMLLVETSGMPGFAGQRRFYARLGFGREARIRGYYRDGDDKIIFAKALTA